MHGVFYLYQAKYPSLSFRIIKGIEDQIALTEEMRNWVKLARRKGIKIHYDEFKYLGYGFNLELAERSFFEYQP